MSTVEQSLNEFLKIHAFIQLTLGFGRHSLHGNSLHALFLFCRFGRPHSFHGHSLHGLGVVALLRHLRVLLWLLRILLRLLRVLLWLLHILWRGWGLRVLRLNNERRTQACRLGVCTSSRRASVRVNGTHTRKASGEDK